MASTSACAVGSLVNVTRFAPSAMNVAIFHNHSTERAALSGADIFNRELNGACHESAAHAMDLTRVETVSTRSVCCRFKACQYKRGLARRKTFLGIDFLIAAS